MAQHTDWELAFYNRARYYTTCWRQHSIFLYDTVKIFVLLSVLIFIIFYIQSYYPPQRTKKILGRFDGVTANCLATLLSLVDLGSLILLMNVFGAKIAIAYVIVGFILAVRNVDIDVCKKPVPLCCGNCIEIK